MKVCGINEVIEGNYNIIFINALQQFWRNTKFFQCFGNGKKQNLILFTNGCKVTYTDKFGNKTYAKSGDVIYTPVGSEYRAELSDFEEQDSHTIGINFLIYDETGEPVVLSEDIAIFSADIKTMQRLFTDAVRSDIEGPLLQSRIVLSKILCALTPRKNKTTPPLVEKAVEYWAKNIEENPSVSQTARYCNISEVYFRKIFKEYMGVSPYEFRNETRLMRACTYLEYGDISVQEISQLLGYSGVSYFIKAFSERYGLSPLKYRKIKKDV